MTLDNLRAEVFLANIESEKIVLGSIFAEPSLLADCKLIPENFGSKRHQILFQTLREMDETGIPIEITAVVESLGMQLEDVGGISYLIELASEFPAITNFDYYQNLILVYFRRRETYKTAQIMMQEALTGEDDQVLLNATNSLSKLEDDDYDDDDGHIKNVLIKLHSWMETDHGEITGASTGYKELDEMTSGLQRQNLVILGGRPSMGKTAMGVQLCLNYSDLGGPTAIFSLEMGEQDLALRMVSNLGNINGKKIRNPMKNFENDDWTRNSQAFGQLSQTPLHLFDQAGINIAFIRRKLRMLKRKYPDQHIVALVDYLQLIIGNPKHAGNRQQEISEISRSLKNIARELDLTIIALSQLSRTLESRQDKRPMLSDLRESGSIEQDADVVIFLYRDDYYDKESELRGVSEVIVAKQRNGPIGTVQLAFAKEYSKFVDIQQ